VIEPRTELFIDGHYEPAASGRTFDDIAGRDGSRIAQVAEGDVEDVDRAVAAARRSFDDRRWSDQPPMTRKRVLLRLAELIRENLDELALLESLDVGKPIRDTLRVDIPSAPRLTSGTPRRSTRRTARSARPARTRCRW
jgi:acyl-CoA reductase-like NAD-dependent aldehyde dehydrogenase